MLTLIVGIAVGVVCLAVGIYIGYWLMLDSIRQGLGGFIGKYSRPGESDSR